MAYKLRKIGIIAKHTITERAEYLRTLIAAIKKHKKDILLDEHAAPVCAEKTAYDKSKILRRADLVIVLGGDGTLLKTAHHMGKRKNGMPLIAGVNMGHLGFLTGYTPHAILTQIQKVLDGDFCEDPRFLLRVTIYRNGKKRFTSLALNEAVINQGGFARLIKLHVEVDTRELAVYHADGLIISTPTGSTGHSLAAGGPIIHPKIEGFAISPICPVKLSMRPIVIPINRQLIIKLETEWRAEKKPIVLTVDGQITVNLKRGDTIRIRRSSRSFTMIRPHNHNYYKMLRQKLSWGE